MSEIRWHYQSVIQQFGPAAGASPGAVVAGWEAVAERRPAKAASRATAGEAFTPVFALAAVGGWEAAEAVKSATRRQAGGWAGEVLRPMPVVAPPAGWQATAPDVGGRRPTAVTWWAIPGFFSPPVSAGWEGIFTDRVAVRPRLSPAQFDLIRLPPPFVYPEGWQAVSLDRLPVRPRQVFPQPEFIRLPPPFVYPEGWQVTSLDRLPLRPRQISVQPEFVRLPPPFVYSEGWQVVSQERAARIRITSQGFLADRFFIPVTAVTVPQGWQAVVRDVAAQIPKRARFDFFVFRPIVAPQVPQGWQITVTQAVSVRRPLRPNETRPLFPPAFAAPPVTLKGWDVSQPARVVRPRPPASVADLPFAPALYPNGWQSVAQEMRRQEHRALSATSEPFVVPVRDISGWQAQTPPPAVPYRAAGGINDNFNPAGPGVQPVPWGWEATSEEWSGRRRPPLTSRLVEVVYIFPFVPASFPPRGPHILMRMPVVPTVFLRQDVGVISLQLAPPPSVTMSITPPVVIMRLPE